MMNRFVFSGRDGVIEFGPFVPDGRLPIAEASSADAQSRVREIVEGICRHAYDGETLLVPGIPEADSDDQALDALFEFRRRVTDRLAFPASWPKAAEEPAPADPFGPGAILYASWGYDQTNVDFYRIVFRKEAAGNDWVKLEKIEKVETSDDTEDRPATMTGRVVPADPIKPVDGVKPILRKLRPNGTEPFVKIDSYTYAYLWDGTPKRVSHYG